MSAPDILLALFNGAWQGALLCLLAAPVLHVYRNKNAATMYAVWSALLGLCLILPLFNYASPAETSIAAQSPLSIRVRAASVPPGRAAVPQARSHRRAVAPDLRLGAFTRTATTSAGALFAAIRKLSARILLVVLVIALVRLTLVARDVVRLFAARRRVERIEAPMILPTIGRCVEFATSKEFETPCVLGLASAIIVLPEALLAGPADRLRAVVMHEFMHVKRNDDWKQVLTRVAEALCFFLPGVLLALRRLALYRERICDDAALEDAKDTIAYADALADLMAGRGRAGATAPGLIFERKHLFARMNVLLDARFSHSLHVDRQFAAASSFALVIAAACFFSLRVPALARPYDASLAPLSPSADFPTSLHVHERGAVASFGSVVFQGKWRIEPCGRSAPQAVQVSLSWAYRDRHTDDSWSESRCVSVPFLHGLTVAELHGPQTQRTIVLARDAGSFQMSGALGDGRGNGTWQFVPSAAFASELKSRGIGAPDTMQQFQLAMGDVKLSTLDMLLRSGFATPSVSDLVQSIEVGDPTNLIRAAASLPGTPRTLDTIRRMQEAGVPADFISGLEQRGFHPTLTDIIRLREVGVTLEWIDRLRARGNRDIDISDLIHLREGGA